MTVLRELRGLTEDLLNPTLAEWKADGGKVVGFFCCYVPEEILHAAGIMPYRLRAPHCTQTSSADVYMSHFNCSYVRSCLQFIYEGRFDFIDGYVFTSSCDQARRLYDVLRETTNGRFMHFLSVPHKVSQSSIAYYRDELARFREKLGDHFGVRVRDVDLQRSIEVYNETRKHLRALYQLRWADSPAITGTDVLNAMLAGTALPREHYNQLLVRLLAELQGTERVPDYRARLMIAGGGGCDDPAFIQTMEEMGGLVAGDSLCWGSRYFWQETEALEDDPLLALAAAYLERPACANMVDKVAERSDFIKEMVRCSNADGVVFQRLRYCDLWGGQLLDVEHKMRQSGIPLLTLEREYGTSSAGQLRTRIQAFLETLGR